MLASSLIFIILILLIIFSELMRQKVEFNVDALLIINLSFIITYGLPGLSLSDSTLTTTGFSKGDLLLVSLLCLISYVFVRLGYKLSYSKSKFIIKKIANKLVIYKTSLICFLIGFGAFYLYTNNYGGVHNSLIFSGAIRSGFGEDLMVGSGSTLFFKNLIPLMSFLPLTLFLCFLNDRKKLYFVGFLFTFAIATFGLFVMAGRGRIAIYTLSLATCAYIFIRSNRNISMKFLLYFLILFFFFDIFVHYGKSFFNLFLLDKTLEELIDEKPYIPLITFSSYYEHRIFSAIIATKQEYKSWTLFYDSLAFPLYLIPSRVFGTTAPDSISFLNTYLFTGIWDSNIPPGLVGYGLYSFGIVGVIFSSLILGFSSGFIDKKFRTCRFNDNFETVVYIPLIFIWPIYFIQGDPRVLLVNVTPLLIFLLILYLYKANLKLK